MNSRHFLAIAAVAAAFSGIARADEADASEFAVQFEGSRTRAEVAAEAQAVARARSNEPAGSRVAAPVKSTVDAQALRAQAAEAVRLGRIPHGEIGS